MVYDPGQECCRVLAVLCTCVASDLYDFLAADVKLDGQTDVAGSRGVGIL